MAGYVINTYLLYYIIFLLLLYWLNDMVSAVFYIFILLFGCIYNFFLFYGELLPGMSFTVLALAVFMNNRVHSSAGKIVLLFSLLLVVRSHPLALLCWGSGMTILFLFNRALFLENKRLVLLIALVGGAAVFYKIVTLNAYDASIIKSTKSFGQSFQELLHPGYTFEVLYYILASGNTLFIFFLCTIAYFLVQQEYGKIFTLLFLVTIMLVVTNISVDFADIKLWHLDGLRKNRWSLPFRFVVFFFFFYYIFRDIVLLPKLLRFTCICLFFLLISGFIRLIEVSENPQYTINYYESILNNARLQGCRKCIMDIETFDVNAYLHRNSFFSSLILSSLNNPDSTIQVLVLEKEKIQQMSTYAADSISLMDIYFISHNDLRQEYFSIPEEKYTRVNIR